MDLQASSHRPVGRTVAFLGLIAILAGCGAEGGPSPAASALLAPGIAASGELASSAPTLAPTTGPTASASSTPRPAATATSTPRPTRPPRGPSDPPIVKLRVGDWVRVVTSSVNIRKATDRSAVRLATMVEGEVALITRARRTADGYDWYGVATPSVPAGFVASGTTDERFLKRVSREAFLSWCGKVTMTDPVRVGSMAVAASAVAPFTLGVLRLVEAVQGEACIAVVPTDVGLAVRVDAGTPACGAPRWDGRRLRLEPTLAGNVVAEYRVRTTVQVSDVLLTKGVEAGPGGRTTLQNVLILASTAPAPFGCIHARVRDPDTGQRERFVMTDSVQCVVATARDEGSIWLRSSTGGDALWFRVTDDAKVHGIVIGQPTAMNVTAQSPDFFSLVENTVPGCG